MRKAALSANKSVIFIIICSFLLSCNSNNSEDMDLDSAVAHFSNAKKELLFISTISGCKPCDLISTDLHTNDTLVNALNKYNVVLFTGGNVNFSIVNKITESIKSPAIYVFDKHGKLKDAFWGYKNAVKFLKELSSSHVFSLEENKHFDKLLMIYINLNKHKSTVEEANYLNNYGYHSFYFYYLEFKVSNQLKDVKRATLNASKALLMSNDPIQFLYGKELDELKQFIDNN